MERAVGFVVCLETPCFGQVASNIGDERLLPESLTVIGKRVPGNCRAWKGLSYHGFGSCVCPTMILAPFGLSGRPLGS